MRGSLASITSSISNTDTYPSPLIMTVLEQLDAKIKADLLAPSDVLAISSFVRKLVFQLMGRAQSLNFWLPVSIAYFLRGDDGNPIILQ